MMSTGGEEWAILRWFRAHGYNNLVPLNTATPLGLLGHTFPRSILPPGTKPFPPTPEDGARVIPGPDSPGMHCRAGDVAKDRGRVEWIKPPSDDL